MSFDHLTSHDNHEKSVTLEPSPSVDSKPQKVDKKGVSLILPHSVSQDTQKGRDLTQNISNHEDREIGTREGQHVPN